MEWLRSKDNGYLMLIMGNMFSGKTTMLRSTLAKFVPLGLNVCYLNSARDSRESEGGNGKFSTHSSLNLSSDKLTELKLDKLSDFTDRLEEFDVIGIDETHFFGDELVPIVLSWVQDHNKCVIVAVLSGTFERKPFSNRPLDLFSEADERKVVDDAFCSFCWERDEKIVRAPFTARITESKDELESGGRTEYLPVCRRHHDSILSRTAE